MVSLNNLQQFKLHLDTADDVLPRARKELIENLSKESTASDDMLAFVQRRQLQTYATLDRLQDALKDSRGGTQVFNDGRFFEGNQLFQKLQLVSQLIQRGFGTRVFYVSYGDFDTHSTQADSHRRLLGELANSINNFFTQLASGGHDKRVIVMTFSEFGRRVQENSSRGTDHGAASCMFVAGPGVKGGRRR